MIKFNRADATSMIGMLEAVKACCEEYPRAKELSDEAVRGL